MNIGGLIFGVFCLFVIVAGVMYMTVMNSQALPITDTYGNTLGNTTNTSHDLAVALPDMVAQDYGEDGQGTVSGLGILILLVGVMVVAIGAFGVWLAAKTILT